ncbi:MAG: hypothetical protein D6805_04670 [Planctomycetota bacterium]|nr:MAG: hypothetical protein D6805_04670 [Planctomycetota bacterium]
MKNTQDAIHAIENSSRTEEAKLLRGKVKILKKSTLTSILEQFAQALKEAQEVEKLRQLQSQAQQELQTLQENYNALQAQNQQAQNYIQQLEEKLQQKEENEKQLQTEIQKLKELLQSEEHLARIESLEIRLASLQEDYKRLSQSYDYMDMIELPQLPQLSNQIQKMLDNTKSYLQSQTANSSQLPTFLNIQEHLLELKERLKRNQNLNEQLLSAVDNHQGEISHVVELVRLWENNLSLERELQLIQWLYQLLPPPNTTPSNQT